MPTYEYQCRSCDHLLEVFQKITDEPLLECPKCHQAALNKVLSATNFQLKGNGWYVTDIRDKDKPKSAAQSDIKSTDASSSGSSSTDTNSTTKSTDES